MSRHQITHEERDELVRLALNGMSARNLKARFQISSQTLYKVLDEYEVRLKGKMNGFSDTEIIEKLQDILPNKQYSNTTIDKIRRILYGDP